MASGAPIDTATELARMTRLAYELETATRRLAIELEWTQAAPLARVAVSVVALAAPTLAELRRELEAREHV